MEVRGRKWKSADAWEKVTLPNGKGNVTNRVPKRKRGAPAKNSNAVGNSGGAPVGNVNALKHGGYSPVYWDTLTEEEKALLENAEPDSETLLREEIELLSIRERRIMNRIREYAEAKGGQLLESVIRNEEKREFDSPEDKALFESMQRAKIESGNLLPGRKYNVSTRTEAAHNVIHRLEEALTRIQAQKQRCIRALTELRQNVTEGGEIDEKVRQEVEAAIRNARDSVGGTGSDDSISHKSSG